MLMNKKKKIPDGRLPPVNGWLVVVSPPDGTYVIKFASRRTPNCYIPMCYSMPKKKYTIQCKIYISTPTSYRYLCSARV